jgi:hypothetical protein
MKKAGGKHAVLATKAIRSSPEPMSSDDNGEEWTG